MPRFDLTVSVNADTLEEAEARVALVQAALHSVESAREDGHADMDEGADEALDRRMGIPVAPPVVPGCTCGSHGAMDGHGYFCALRGPNHDL